MHRSGTSTLAGTLRNAGVYFGEVLDTKISFNPKGLNEAPAVLFMQQDLLEKNGGEWHDPPATVVWGNLHKAVRDLFIESRAGRSLWAFKDPRTLLTLEGWLDALPGLDCVGIFRHPAEVAMSIHLRNDFPIAKCIEIWRIYNARLLAIRNDRDVPVIEFVSDPEAMAASFSALLAHVGLAPSPDAMGFYDTAMKHHDRPQIDLPPGVEELYHQLRDGAL